MSDLRKAAQQALEAFTGLLTFNPTYDDYENGRVAVDALRAALVQPEQEPVAWRYLEDPFGANEYLITDDPDTAKGPGWTPLYTDPPQRKPLTDEEIYKLFGYDNQHCVVPGYAMSFVRAVEKAHGIGGEV